MKSDIQNTLLIERIESLENVKIGWVKKNGFDLLLKYLILLFNSLGRKSNNRRYLFIDEIKNNNMHNNLMKTKAVFDKHNEATALLCFHQIQRENHYRFGFLMPIYEILLTCFVGVGLLILSLFGRSQIKVIINFLSLRFEKTTHAINDVKEIYMMTDHHFYSSIIAFSMPDICVVLQHGLVMDKRLCYPVRAGKFCAWGEHSKELLNSDSKVVVTGTYKFKDMCCIECKGKNRVMFCIGSLNNEEVKRKIEVLIRQKEEKGFKLLIKCHPGSLFNTQQWEELYKGKGIEFYKEELIQNIDFDLAISENSTAIMDLIVLKKPFILFDNIDGYFSEYASLIPYGNEEKKISEVIEKIHEYDFNNIISSVIRNELNSGDCTIYEMRRI